MSKVTQTNPDTAPSPATQGTTVTPIGQMSPISDILSALREYLEFRILEETKGDKKEFGLNNVLNIELSPVKKEKDTTERDVVITLLRIEEETSRKPQESYYTEIVKIGKDEYRKAYPTSPSIAINLEILISSHSPNYSSALTLISHVIRIMNSIKTAPKPKKMNQQSFDIIREMSVSMMNMPFDQYLSMWQTLGGELVPAVAYKVRMVTIIGIPDTHAVPVIEKVFHEFRKKKTGKDPDVQETPESSEEVEGERIFVAEVREKEDNKR